MDAAHTARLLDDLIDWGSTLRRIAEHIHCSPSSLSAIRRRQTRTVNPRIADPIARAHNEASRARRIAHRQRPAA